MLWCATYGPPCLYNYPLYSSPLYKRSTLFLLGKHLTLDFLWGMGDRHIQLLFSCILSYVLAICICYDLGFGVTYINTRRTERVN